MAGKLKDNPRYNVISFRVTDTEHDLIYKASGGNRAEYCRDKVLKGIEKEVE